MTISNRVAAIQQIAAGKAQHSPSVTLTSGAVTAGIASCGFFTLGLTASTIGTTYPNTLVSLPGVPSPSSPFRNLISTAFPASTKGGWLARIYVIGTLNLTATGNQFTHHAATFPILRTKYGQANQPLNLVPLIYITTQTATTAPAFVLQTSSSGAGYVNQAGSNVVGSKTFTLPAAATAAQSLYLLRLEDGDSAVQDISQINVTSAGTAGTATIFGMEKLSPLIALTTINTVYDGLLGGLGLQDFTPGVATSGTASSYLVWIVTSASATMYGHSITGRNN